MSSFAPPLPLSQGPVGAVLYLTKNLNFPPQILIQELDSPRTTARSVQFKTRMGARALKCIVFKGHVSLGVSHRH